MFAPPASQRVQSIEILADCWYKYFKISKFKVYLENTIWISSIHPMIYVQIAMTNRKLNSINQGKKAMCSYSRDYIRQLHANLKHETNEARPRYS
jgi:hypothetical protein